MQVRNSGILLLAVVDQRLVDAAEARSAVRRQIFDVERLDDVDHEIGAGDAADAIAVGLRRAGLGGDRPARSAAAPTVRARPRRRRRRSHSRLAARPRSRRRRRPQPVRKLRRSTFGPESLVPKTLRAMDAFPRVDCCAATLCSPRSVAATVLQANLSHQSRSRLSRHRSAPPVAVRELFRPPSVNHGRRSI